MKIKSMEVLVHEFMLDFVCTFFFYQYIVPPLVKQLYKYQNCKRMDILIKLYEEVSDVYNC